MVRMLLGLQESVDASLSEYAILWTNVTGDPVMEDMLDGRRASIVFVFTKGFQWACRCCSIILRLQLMVCKFTREQTQVHIKHTKYIR